MKTLIPTLIFASIFGAAGTLRAQPFNSGSTGAYGPLNVTSNTTLDLPADGIINCTTITVAPNVTLSFNRNPLNTPVYLLATGDVTVSGTVSVSGTPPSGNNTPGKGGPGGFDGGWGGYGAGMTSHGGDGFGPGAGKNVYAGQHAVYGAPTLSNTNVYGNALLSPLMGGSGGAGSDGNPGGYGGGGGGAILIASNTRISVDGLVVADGAGGSSGAGSGGGIRLVSPVVTGRGRLQANSPYAGPSGRVRIDCIDRYAFRSLVYSAGTVTRGAQMFVFPPVVPRLDIITAAGQTIAEGTASEVTVNLPTGGSTNQTVTVQGRNFAGIVPIALVVTPENGPSVSYPAQIDMTTGNPAQTVVNVVIPPGTTSRLNAWTH